MNNPDYISPKEMRAILRQGVIRGIVDARCSCGCTLRREDIRGRVCPSCGGEVRWGSVTYHDPEAKVLQ